MTIWVSRLAGMAKIGQASAQQDRGSRPRTSSHKRSPPQGRPLIERRSAARGTLSPGGGCVFPILGNTGPLQHTVGRVDEWPTRWWTVTSGRLDLFKKFTAPPDRPRLDAIGHFKYECEALHSRRAAARHARCRCPLTRDSLSLIRSKDICRRPSQSDPYDPKKARSST